MPVDKKDIVSKDTKKDVVGAEKQDDMPELIDGVSDADDIGGVEEVENIGEGDSVIMETIVVDDEADLTSINALFTDLHGLSDALVAFKKDPSALMKQTLKHKLTGVTLAKRRVDIDIKEQTA